MLRWIKKINDYLFPQVKAIQLNEQQIDALQRIEFHSDRYLEKKEELKRKLGLFQYSSDWNPLNDIQFGTPYEKEDIIFLSDTIVSIVEQDPFFKIYCSNILRSLILFVSKMPNHNSLSLEYIYSLITNTKNNAELFIKIGLSTADERESLEKWHQVPIVGMSKLALCIEPYVRKKYSNNIISFIQ